MTLADALALALAQGFETTAAGFYRTLAGRVPAEVSPLAHELADEEERHGAMLRALAADPRLAEHLRRHITAPATTPAFETCAAPPGPAGRTLR